MLYNKLMRIIEFKIKTEDNNHQIRDFLRDFGVSSSLLTKLKQTENGITVNGEFRRTIDFLHTDDILKIAIAEKGHLPTPSDISLNIIYEDEDIIVVDKPPFMPVHESRNHRGDTLSNAVANHIKKDMAFRAVFRLDRDTSGLVLIAKNELAASKLAGNINKDYYAIINGVLNGSGTIDAPIKRVGESIIKRCVADDGERAVTHYTVIKSNNKYSLLKINLETGRTHQIRVHFSNLGFPLVGDTLYGDDTEVANRQLLHCKDIYFTHPITNEKMHLSCAFPNDFEGLI